MQSCQNLSLNPVSKGFCTFDVEFCSINSEGVTTTWSWGSDGLQFSKQSSQELYEPCQCSSSKVRALHLPLRPPFLLNWIDIFCFWRKVVLSWTANVREQATPTYGHNEHNVHVAAYMVIESVWCICWFCLTSVENNTSTCAFITFTISFWCIILNWFTGMFSHTCYYTEIILLVLKSAWYSSADNLGEFAFSLYTKIYV